MKQLTIILIIFLSAITLNAQKIKKVNGKTDALKGQTEINVMFVYPDDMKVGKMTEKEYVKSKMEKAEEDEKGKGEKWLEMWKADRDEHYMPMFVQLFNDVMIDKNEEFELVETDLPEYTMIVTTTFIEPGFNIGITKKNASINLKIDFVESKNHDKILVSYTITNSPGRSAFGGDFDTGVRVGEAYAKAGKEFAKYLLKAKVF